MTEPTEPALEAAQALAAAGHHVHYISEGERRCFTGHRPMAAR